MRCCTLHCINFFELKLFFYKIRGGGVPARENFGEPREGGAGSETHLPKPNTEITTSRLGWFEPCSTAVKAWLVWLVRTMFHRACSSTNFDSCQQDLQSKRAHRQLRTRWRVITASQHTAEIERGRASEGERGRGRGRGRVRGTALEATQGQMYGVFSQLPYTCHLEEVASVRN